MGAHVDTFEEYINLLKNRRQLEFYDEGKWNPSCNTINMCIEDLLMSWEMFEYRIRDEYDYFSSEDGGPLVLNKLAQEILNHKKAQYSYDENNWYNINNIHFSDVVRLVHNGDAVTFRVQK